MDLPTRGPDLSLEKFMTCFRTFEVYWNFSMKPLQPTAGIRETCLKTLEIMLRFNKQGNQLFISHTIFIKMSLSPRQGSIQSSKYESAL
jgi:hypothetical protein